MTIPGYEYCIEAVASLPVGPEELRLLLGPEPQAPHHCNLFGQPLAPGDLRIEWPEHEPALSG